MSIDRRQLLTGMAALATLGPAALMAKGRRRRVGVIGAGIIGASTALQLARAGADVVVFERMRPGAGATQASVAWINPVVADPAYMRLRLESMKAWAEDDRRLGLGAIWGGSINWAYAAKESAVRAKGAALAGSNDPPRYLSAAQIREECPGVEPGDGVKVAFQTRRDGHVDPVFATERYLAAAKALGAKVLYPCEVTAVMRVDGRVTGVHTTQGDVALDALVSVGGTDTPAILSMVGKELTLAHKPGLTLITDRQPLITDKVFEASSLIEFKQYADGRFLTSFTGGPPDIPVHAGIRMQQMDYPDEALRAQHGRMLIERTSAYLPAIARAAPADVRIGFRPYPLDNRPICGHVAGVDGLYVIVTHSGVTLAPILGRHAAQEIMRGVQQPMLAPYRPQRYLGG